MMLNEILSLDDHAFNKQLDGLPLEGLLALARAIDVPTSELVEATSEDLRSAIWERRGQILRRETLLRRLERLKKLLELPDPPAYILLKEQVLIARSVLEVEPRDLVFVLDMLKARP